MKKKYQDILMESAQLVGEIPGVNMSTATATTSVYVTAYNDYHKACQLLGIIVTNIELMNNLESTINKYRDKEDYDIEELRRQVDRYTGLVDNAYQELKAFIDKRKIQNWK